MFKIADNNNEIYQVGALFRELHRKYNMMETKKHLYKDITDLTIIEINTIEVIGYGEKVSMSHIANSLGVTFGTPTVTIDRLSEKGYVERIRDEGDRRQVFIKLSEKGLKVFEHVMSLRNELTKRVFGIFSPEERDAIISVIKKLNNEFEGIFLDRRKSGELHQK